MAHKPIAIANEFIRRFGVEGDIDHLKLQKLAYFAQGWWLGLKGPALVTERPQVWRYGPVFQSLYQIFSPCGRGNITAPRGASPFGHTAPPTLEGNEFSQERDCIEWVWGEYGHLSGARLSDLTHDVGTPWRNLASEKNFRVPLYTEIPEDADRAYFHKLAMERGIDD